MLNTNNFALITKQPSKLCAQDDFSNLLRNSIIFLNLRTIALYLESWKNCWTRPKNSTGPICFSVNTLTHGPIAQAEKWCTHYSNFFLESTDPAFDVEWKAYVDALINEKFIRQSFSNHNAMLDNPFSLEEISIVIKKLKSNWLSHWCFTQAGFVKEKSTFDHITAIRIITFYSLLRHL